MAGDAIVSALWRLNVYGTIKARFLFDAMLFKVSCAQPCKIAKNLVQIPFYSNALYNNVFVRIWIFLSTSFDKQVSEPFEPLERLVYSSE